MDVRVRFPPSPTGNLHVGSVRTALFNFLFVRKYKGKLILRIEDTDKKREVKEAYQAIYDSLKWLGLSWDEGPILQSDRLDIYKEYEKMLLDKGLVYEQDGATYLKTVKSGQTKWIDLIGKKEISFNNETIDDFVIYKSDGFPVYHFANVVDDHLMEVTHVIRGEDIMSSTPKQLMLYSAFGWEVPEFAHIPVILATDRSKLSKRHGAVGILDFKKDGYIKEALLNYLALLGWTPPSGQEILSLEEMIEEFDLSDINTSSAIFDIRKLEWMNGEYIRNMQDEELEEKLDEFLVDHPAKGKIKPIIPLVKTRIKKLSDFIPLTNFFFTKPEYDMQIFNRLEIGELNEALTKTLETLQNLQQPFEAAEFEQSFKKLSEDLKLSNTQMFQLIRVAISGQLVTPPLFESIRVLGEDETVKRVKEALHSL
ncbi:MAG: Glutamate--tRNA ligase [Microgenomates group bacterium Gr01-1014_7]|nr:MAG: Glutamate--tRNA ligase [Microgenomates group bacterium Gr01-1014_7]